MAASVPLLPFCWIANVIEQWHPSSQEFQSALDIINNPLEIERIRRYHKGAPTHVGYPHHTEPDPKCFVMGRVMLQHAYLIYRHAILQQVPKYTDVNDECKLPEEVQETAIHSFSLSSAKKLSSVYHRYIEILRTEEGRPYYVNPPSSDEVEKGKVASSFNCNISHAGGVIILAAHPTQLVGVDVMPIELVPSQPLCSLDDLEEFFSYLKNHFTTKEWLWIRNGSERCFHHSNLQQENSTETGSSQSPPQIASLWHQLKRFYVLWTLKEAYVKALGIGLGFDLQSAEFHFHFSEEADVDRRFSSNIHGHSSSDIRDVTDADEFFHFVSFAQSPSSSPPTEEASKHQLLHNEKKEHFMEHKEADTKKRRFNFNRVELRVDDIPQKKWRFVMFEFAPWNIVGAVAYGPCEEAATTSYAATVKADPKFSGDPDIISEIVQVEL